DLGKAVDGINLERLGVALDQVRTGYSAAGREAVEAFRAATAEVDRLGLTAEQRADALGQAFDGAFGRAKTKADLDALKKALQDAFDAADIGIAGYNARIEQVTAKLAELGGAAQKAGSQALKPPDTTQYRERIDETVRFSGDAADRMQRDQERI